MNPSPAAIAAIQAYGAALSGGWAGQTDAQVLTAANAATVDNPAQQGTVAKPYTYDDLLGAISSANVSKLVVLPALPAIVETINSGDLVACARWITTLVAGGVITTDEATAVSAVMTATEADPSYQSKISWAVANLGRPVDLVDIQQSRPQ